MDTLSRKSLNPILVVSNLCLAIISGWALQNLEHSSTYSTCAFSAILLHSIFGFLACIHPDYGNVLQRISQQTSLVVGAVSLPLITADLCIMLNLESWLVFGILFIAGLPILAKFIKNHVLYKYILDFCTLVNIVFLIYIIIILGTGYWIGGLIALIALNHFAFGRLSLHYEISSIEVTTIGYIFFVMFSLNSLTEMSRLKNV